MSETCFGVAGRPAQPSSSWASCGGEVVIDDLIFGYLSSVELSRGAVGGPKIKTDVVQALATDQYKLTFRADEVARIAVSGDGDTRLDLYIYDEHGNLVASPVGPGDDCLASWVPRWTGIFVTWIVNRGLVSNKYLIVTN